MSAGGAKYPHLDDAIRPEDASFPQIARDLQTLSDARNYHRWLYTQIKGALGTRIVEVGAGIGNYTPLLLEHGQVWALEPDPPYAEYLRRRFAGLSRLHVVELALDSWSSAVRDQIRGYRADTFVCLNVLEHVEADAAAIAAMYDCLEPGGSIALVLPALSALFSPLDRRYGHYRRYTRRDVPRLIAGLHRVEVPYCRYLNVPGVLGWWINHVVLKREQLPSAQTRFFDRTMVPVASALEKIAPPPFGLSLALWLRKGA